MLVPAALVVGAAALVALATQGRPAWMLVREGQANRLVIVADLALLFGLAGVLVGGGLLLVYRTRLGPGPEALPHPTTVIRLLPAGVATLTGISLFMMAVASFGGEEDGPTLPGEVAEAEEENGFLRMLGEWDGGFLMMNPDLGDEGDEGPLGPPVPLPYWLTSMGLLAAALAGATVWWWTRGRAVGAPVHAGPDPSGRAERDRVRGTIMDTIEAMLTDPNPNTAIRGAYARLLQGLQARGRGRKDHEGPREHLHRVLSTLDVRPDPLQKLIELFQLARFSSYDLTAAHRDEALAALRAVADDLADTPDVRQGPEAQRAPRISRVSDA